MSIVALLVLTTRDLVLLLPHLGGLLESPRNGAFRRSRSRSSSVIHGAISRERNHNFCVGEANPAPPASLAESFIICTLP